MYHVDRSFQGVLQIATLPLEAIFLWLFHSCCFSGTIDHPMTFGR